MTEALFRLIHLSDFHFCIQPNRRNAVLLYQRNPAATLDTCLDQVWNAGLRSLLKPESYVPEVSAGVALFAYQRVNICDAIVITGDLATTGMASDIQSAAVFLSERAMDGFSGPSGQATLSAAGLPIYLIPGNHDTFRGEYTGAPGSPHFSLAFGTYMRNLDGRVCHWVREKSGRHLALIGADFSLRRRADARDPAFGAFGQGRVYPEVLAALKTRTTEVRRRIPGVEIVWIIHFAPFDCGASLELLDRADVIRSAGELAVRTILCGHTHETSVCKRGNVTVYCSGAACAVDRDGSNEVHLLEYTVGTRPQVRRQTFRWSYQHDEFILDQVD